LLKVLETYFNAYQIYQWCNKGHNVANNRMQKDAERSGAAFCSSS